MNATLIGAILFIAGLVIGIVILLAFQRWSSLEKRVKDLEECKNKRLPYNTAAGVEDAIAVSLDVVRQFQEGKLRAEQMLAILQQVRGGPDGYDPERPAGRRPDGLKTEAQLFEEAARRNREER